MLPTRMMSLESELLRNTPLNRMASKPGDHVHPKLNDVILGRGNLHASHPGNVRFYSIIDQFLPLYETAESRPDKTKVVQDIYDTITSAGRFVKDDPASAACFVIETNAAKKKISHAIRFRRESARRSPASFGKAKSSKAPDQRPRLSFQPAKRKHKERQQQCPTRELPTQNKDLEKNFGSGDESSSDCIIPDDELSSVLLLPPHEMDQVSQMYEALIRGNQSRDNRSNMTQNLGYSNTGTGNGHAAGKSDDTTPFHPTIICDTTSSSSTFYPRNVPAWNFPP